MLKGNHFLLIICLFGFLFGSCKKNTNSEKQQPCPGGCGIADFSLIDYQPAWSPGGKYIAYYHIDKEISKNGIYLITPDGKENRLWHRGVGAETPTWSPDGQWVAFSEGAQIWKKKLNGDSLIQITNAGRNFFPAWSPDGKWITFVQGAQIYKMPFDGQKFDEAAKMQLTNSERNFFPAWSPDNNWIGYQRTYSYPESMAVQGIWCIKSTGENNIQLFSGNSGYPEWKSPAEILFIRGVTISGNVIGDSVIAVSTMTKNTSGLLFLKGDNRYPKLILNHTIALISGNNSLNSGTQVYTVDESEGNLKKLTTDGATGLSGSPEGKIVYVRFDFTRIDESKGVLWTINGDGSNKKQLTNNQFKITQ